MIAEIVSVGTELLMGQIVNTNAQYIAQQLAALGINLYHQATVGDNKERLMSTIKLALSRADIVILTGGLGPTQDDLTKETVAAMFSLPMLLDKPSLEYMEAYFKRLNRKMTPNNKRQAEFPRGSIILKNPNGTAPGCIVEHSGKAAILLPGPPNELIPMFESSVWPYLEKRSGSKFYSKVLRIFGIGESAVEDKLMDLIEKQTNPTIAPYAQMGEVTLRITANCKNNEDPEPILAPTIREICQRLGENVYSCDGEPLEKVVYNLLKEKNVKLAVAESCTGGMLVSQLINVPGVSNYLLEGTVTYSNDAKIRQLRVKPETLEFFGAVSEQTAREMAEGMLFSSGADIAVSTTGIAGPDGGSKEKPIGLTFIGIATRSGSDVMEFQFSGNRQRVRTLCTLNALDLIRRNLLNIK